jgi:4-amino-4-deoxy-L-arabinose transferase-like glycosyltransferase
MELCGHASVHLADPDMNPALTPRNTIILFALSLGVSAATRFAVIPITLINGDEGIYLLISREILDGVLPYQGSFDHKPVGLYYLFALAQLLFGQDVHAIRLLAILACALTAFFLALTLMAAVRSGLFAAAMAAVLYGLASLTMGGLATNTEILLNCYFAMALAVFHLARLSERYAPGCSSLAGLLLGLMFHTNYLGAPAIAGFGIGYLVAVFARGDLSNALRIFCGSLWRRFSSSGPSLSGVTCTNISACKPPFYRSIAEMTISRLAPLSRSTNRMVS